MAEVIEIRIQDNTPAATAASLAGPPRPPRLPTTAAPPGAVTTSTAPQQGTPPVRPPVAPGQTPAGQQIVGAAFLPSSMPVQPPGGDRLAPVVADLAAVLRDNKGAMGRRQGEWFGAVTAPWVPGSPTIAGPSRNQQAMLGGLATAGSTAFGPGGGMAASALMGFAMGGPVVGGIQAFTGALSLATHWLAHWRQRVEETADQLKKFSGPLSAAQAMEDVKNIRQDIERAQKMGGELAEFVKARGEFEREKKEFEDKILRNRSGAESRTMQAQTEILRGINRGESSTETLLKAMNRLVGAAEKTAENTEKAAAKDPQTDFLDQLRAAVEALRDRPVPVDEPANKPEERRINMPIFGGGGL